jgi:hypothetical protein
MFKEMGVLIGVVLLFFGIMIAIYMVHKPTQKLFTKLDIYPNMATKVGKDGKILFFAAFGGVVIYFSLGSLFIFLNV